MSSARTRSRRIVGPTLRLALLSAVSTGVAIVAVVAADRPPAATAIVAGVVGLAALALATTRFELVTLVMIGARTAIEVGNAGADGGLLRISVLITGGYTVAAIAWLVARHLYRRLRFSPVAIGAAAVTAAAVLSGILSDDRTQALTGATRWVFLTVFVIVLENLITDPRSVRRLLLAVGASLLVPLLLGTWQMVGGEQRIVDGISRVEGSFTHPNTYGFYLAVIGLGLFAIVGNLPKGRRLAGYGLLLVVIANLVATYSRTSWVALVVGLVTIAVFGRRWLLLVVVAGAIAFAPLVPGIGNRLADLSEGTTLRGTPGNSLTWRIDYWGTVIDAGEGRRVTGLGLGVASDVTAQQREPHNDLVRAYVEMGGIGLAAYLGFLLAMGWQIRRSLVGTRRVTGPPGLARSLAEGYAGIFAAYVVGSLTGNLMTQLVVLWYVLAVAAAAGLPARHSGGPPDRRTSRPRPKPEPAHG